MLGYANHLNMFSEEIARSGEQLGNTPQAFSHLALIRLVEPNMVSDNHHGLTTVNLALHLIWIGFLQVNTAYETNV